MCVIIHKPAGLRIPESLLRAAASLNRDGWGLMGFAEDGSALIERHEHVDTAQLLATEARLQAVEYALHLRLLTRGSTHQDNVHPLPLGAGSYLMHNGTVAGLATPQPGRSDSWHFANDVLAPLLRRDGELLSQPAFQRLVELALGEGNRAALLNAKSRRIHLFNRHLGAEIDGLWCSSTRWIDQRIHRLTRAPQPQERSLAPETYHFI